MESVGFEEDNMVIAEARVTALHIGLAAAMHMLQEHTGITNQEIGNRMDKAETGIVRLQSAFRPHLFDDAIRYFATMDAELLVAAQKDGVLYQISDPYVAALEASNLRRFDGGLRTPASEVNYKSSTGALLPWNKEE